MCLEAQYLGDLPGPNLSQCLLQLVRSVKHCAGRTRMCRTEWKCVQERGERVVMTDLAITGILCEQNATRCWAAPMAAMYS